MLSSINLQLHNGGDGWRDLQYERGHKPYKRLRAFVEE